MSTKLNVARALVVAAATLAAATGSVLPATATIDGSVVECQRTSSDAKVHPNIEFHGAGVVTAGDDVPTAVTASVWSSEGLLCVAQVGPGKFGLVAQTLGQRHPYKLVIDGKDRIKTDG